MTQDLEKYGWFYDINLSDDMRVSAVNLITERPNYNFFR